MDSVTDLLCHFGFSKNEARVYVALMQETAATGYQISKSTGISRAEVYRVLGNLADKGAVVWQQTEPALYIAVDPETYLTRLESQFTRNIQKVREELKEVNRQESNETIVYLKGYDHIVYKAKEMIASARHELYLRCGAALAVLLQKDLQKLAERGAKVRILSYGDFSMEGVGVVVHPLRHDGVHRNRVTQLLVISDIRKLLVGQLDPESLGTVTGTYSESKEIIHTVREILRSSFHLTILLNESEVISQFMEEHELFKDIYMDGSILRYE